MSCHVLSCCVAWCVVWHGVLCLVMWCVRFCVIFVMCCHVMLCGVWYLVLRGRRGKTKQTRTLEASSLVSSLLEPELFGFRPPMPPAACSAYCVHPCVYVFVYASMCACTYVFVGYVCVFVYVASACVCVDACMRPCLSYVCVDACMHPCLSINMCVRICAYTRACVYMSAPGRQACDARAQTRTAFGQGYPV